MRLPAVQFLILVVAMCVGLQSTAVAMGMSCAQPGSSSQAMPADLHHGDHAAAMHEQGMDMSDAGMTHHGHHGAEQTALDDLVCQCGDACVMASCIGGAPGIASSGITVINATTLIARAIPEPVTAPRSAHGLDLIRPPSRS